MEAGGYPRDDERNQPVGDHRSVQYLYPVVVPRRGKTPIDLVTERPQVEPIIRKFDPRDGAVRLATAAIKGIPIEDVLKERYVRRTLKSRNITLNRVVKEAPFCSPQHPSLRDLTVYSRRRPASALLLSRVDSQQGDNDLRFIASQVEHIALKSPPTSRPTSAQTSAKRHLLYPPDLIRITRTNYGRS